MWLGYWGHDLHKPTHLLGNLRLARVSGYHPGSTISYSDSMFDNATAALRLSSSLFGDNMKNVQPSGSPVYLCSGPCQNTFNHGTHYESGSPEEDFTPTGVAPAFPGNSKGAMVQVDGVQSDKVASNVCKLDTKAFFQYDLFIVV